MAFPVEIIQTGPNWDAIWGGVQAIGSVLAILVAVFVSWWEGHRTDRAERRRHREFYRWLSAAAQDLQMIVSRALQEHGPEGTPPGYRARLANADPCEVVLGSFLQLPVMSWPTTAGYGELSAYLQKIATPLYYLRSVKDGEKLQDHLLRITHEGWADTEYAYTKLLVRITPKRRYRLLYRMRAWWSLRGLKAKPG